MSSPYAHLQRTTPAEHPITTCAFDQLLQSIGRSKDRRTVFQAPGASALGGGAGVVGVDGVTGKPGKKEKKKRKQGASLAQQDLLACQDAILGRCLIGDTICIARGNECCTHLSAGRTGDAVICLIGFAGGRVR